jgi:carboxypeptidase family protein/TonB-dependent receptor-like protein
MKVSYRPALIAFVAFLVAAGAFAQTAGTTSTLAGTATTDGKPLPGVTVTISSPSLQGTRTTVTGEGGGYTFPALPPGVYTVQFSLEGMQTVTRKVPLALATPARADVEMKVGGVTESITVTASAPAVLETTQIGSNFKQESIQQLPTARDIRQTVLLAPGVNPNGVNRQITISGGPSYDNVFLVNGVVVNENLRGQPHSLFIEDAIQETAVMTAGISAEYGRFTGGVVSTLTKSGGNDFTGSFRDTLTDPSWTDTPDFPGASKPVDKVNQVYEATLGGRIIRDRLWFFGAGRKAKTAVQRQTVFTLMPFVNSFDEKRYEGKLTGAITSKHNLIASYLNVKNTESNNFFGDIYDYESLVPSRELPNALKTVNYSGILTSNILAELAWSDKTFAFQNSGGRFTDRIRGTWISDQVTGARMNAPVFCGVCTPEERNSGSIGAKGTYFLSTRGLGNQTIVFGGDRFHETRIVNNHQSGSDYTISARVIVAGTKVYPRFDSTTQLSWQPIFLNSTGTDLNSKGVFVNDRWDLNSRLQFNLGLRYDANHAVDADKNLISDDKNISPRLGVMYDVTGNGRHKLSATFARYAAKITDGSNVLSTSQAAGNPGNFTYAYTGPVVNPAGTPNDQLVSAADALKILFDWYDSKGGNNYTTFVTSTYPGYGSRFKDSLKSPAADEYSLGYGVQLGHSAYARLDGIRRKWHNFYAAEVDTPALRLTPPNNIASDMRYTVNDDQFTKRTYDAVELQSQWNRGHFNVGGNYTWSKLWGNDLGEGSGTATIRNNPGQIFYPEYLQYAQRRPMGYLGQDRTHRARVWGGYDLHTGFGAINVSVLESYDSGFAYSAVGQIDPSGRNANFVYTGIPKNPGYVLNAMGTQDYYFSDRGAFRSDSRLATDLALNYSLPLIRGVQFFVRGDLLNLFNTQTIVDPSLINTDVITSRTGAVPTKDKDGNITNYNSGLWPFNPYTDTPVECPRGASAKTCYDMHANFQLGPNFGKATSADAYQIPDRSLAPRTYRLSLGVRF